MVSVRAPIYGWMLLSLPSERQWGLVVARKDPEGTLVLRCDVKSARLEACDSDRIVELLLGDDGGIEADHKGFNNYLDTVNSRQILQISFDRPCVLFGRNSINDSKESGSLD